jgi:hypothetical protein
VHGSYLATSVSVKEVEKAFHLLRFEVDVKQQLESLRVEWAHFVPDEKTKNKGTIKSWSL